MRLPKKRFYKKVIKKVTVVALIFLYLTPWNLAYALVETTHTLPTDTSFNTEGYSDDTSNVTVSNTEVRLNIKEDWWNEDYQYKRAITIRNIGTTASLSSGTPIQATIDLTSLGLGTTKLQTDLDDLRVVYSVGATHTELARSYFLDTGTTSVATITFPLQTELGIGATNTNYSIYYGNTQASYTGNSGYNFERDGDDATATLVCPFNGSTTCVDGETPSTETGAIRYSGQTGSALILDGVNDGVTFASSSFSWQRPNITQEAWIKLNKSGQSLGLIGNSSYWVGMLLSNGSIQSQIRFSNWDSLYLYGPSLSINTWHHIAVSVDSTLARLYVDGTLRDSGSTVGKTLGASQQSFEIRNGSYLIDEVRVSDVARYTSNFTPQTIPFAPDSNTKLLLHFDENGDDPRNSGKAIDSSGNGNDGTINGAKYTEGIVAAQNNPGHNGVFVEEGTTNLITNPSFENSTSYNTGWKSDYFNYDQDSVTFTPNVAKRNSAGPFAAGVLPQGNLDAGGTGDMIMGAEGTQIKSQFYSTFDPYQGSIVLWVTPEWDGDDGKKHILTNPREGTNVDVLYKHTDNKLYWDMGWQDLVSVDVSDWQAGDTYLVTARWDRRNYIKDDKYLSISVGDTHSYARTIIKGLVYGNARRIVGNDATGAYPANAIIEGLTIYRRPLWDGEYGIDVGNGDEIAQIYNSGTGKDPTLVTGSWDVVFALPTNASTGSLGVGGTGQAWSHPHASNVLYTDTTNTGGFMMGGDAKTDGWRQNHWSQAYGTGTTTFTPNVSKRNSAGPFAQGVMVGGAGETHASGDGIFSSLGSRISSYFYSNLDGEQGSVVFWVTPEWNGNDGQEHYLFEFSDDTVPRHALYKSSDGYLAYKTKHGGTVLGPNISAWSAGETHNVVFSWDHDNGINASSNELRFSVDNEHTFNNDDVDISINGVRVGYGSGTARANAIIEGFTIYRRPLFDGTYGIDVGNGDEIEQIYNSGSGRDPTLVTGSWDVVFALPTNAAGGSLGVGGTGQAWSHPHASNVLYTDTTNTGGFMMGGDAKTDGWQALSTTSAPNSLMQDLKAFWKMNEASGTRYDSVGTNHLLDNNTVGSFAGVIGIGSSFVDEQNESLTIDDNDDLSVDGEQDFSISTWFNIDGNEGWTALLGKFSGSWASAVEYALRRENGSGKLGFLVSNGVGTTLVVSNSVISLGSWHHVIVSRDTTAGLLNMYYDGVGSSIAYSDDIAETSEKFRIGGKASGFDDSDVLIDSVGLWKRVLTDGERTALYNSGNGLEYPFVLPLASSEKIYGGGYKWTSNDYNQGIGYTLNNLTAGQNYVVRALANSGDGVGQPKIFIYDNTNGHDITSFVGTTASTRTDPDVMLFTFELPTVARYASDPNYSWVASDTTSITVKLVNASNTGEVHFHQVELLENLIDNPSLEVGSSATGPWIPSGWANSGIDTGDSTKEQSVVYSGNASFKIIPPTKGEYITNSMDSYYRIGSFYSFGAFYYGAATLGPHILERQDNSSDVLVSKTGGAYWSHYPVIARYGGNVFKRVISMGSNTSTHYTDDFYHFALTPVSLTVTPSTLTNSTETTGVRVDGADVHTEVVNSNEILVNRGTIKFTFTPRHSFDIGSSFGVANPVIMHAYEDANNYIKLHKSDSTTLQLVAMIGGTQVGVGWTNPTLNSGTSYPMIISYESGGSLRLNVSGTDVGTTTISVGTTFSTVPSTIYWGTDNGGGGSNPYDGTYLTNSGSYSVSALATTDKIFSGGYKTVSDGAVQGIGYTLANLTAGADYVVRALAHSDSTSVPKIQIWDLTNNHELTSLTGTNTSTRTDPDTLIFTFELPTVARYASDPNYSWVSSDTTSIEVRLLNTQTSGTAYFHQVEVLPNLVDNPSLEVGSTATGPWIPSGWSTAGAGPFTSGSVIKDTDNKVSGACSVYVDAGFNNGIRSGGLALALGKYVGTGYRYKVDSGSYLRDLSWNQENQHQPAGSYFDYSLNNTSWSTKHYISRTRLANSSNHTFYTQNSNGLNIDDSYYIQLSDVSLTVAPASEANSTESTGLRVDGADTAVQTVSGLSVDRGKIKFKFTPRHNQAAMRSIGETIPYIAEFYVHSENRDNPTNRVYLEILNSTLIRFNHRSNWVNHLTGGCDLASPFVGGQTYDMQYFYDANADTATLSIDGTTVCTLSASFDNFSNAIDRVSWGQDAQGGRQIDATFSNFVALTPTENTSSPYYHFGSKSLKLVNSGSMSDQYTIDVGATNTNTLSAYVYDGTTGNVGGVVSDIVAQLFYNNSAVGTTYTDQGGGWWRLTGSVTGIGTTVGAGVEVKAGKTVYVDGVQLEQKSFATTYADGNLGVGYSWTGTANESRSYRTAVDMGFSSTNNINSSAGTIILWTKYDKLSGNQTFYRSNSDSYFLFRTNNGILQVQSGNGGYNDLGSTLVLNQWNHVALTWGNSEMKLYLNGVLDSEGAGSPPNISGNFSLGGTNGTELINGTISDFRIFDKALTETEVASLYYTGLTTHSKADEEVDRYRASGTYTSSVMDLGNNGEWGAVPLSIGATVNTGIGETVSYLTRTSADNSTWGDWVNVGVGGSIGSQPLRYLQLKAELSSSTDESQTPELNSMVVSYVGDATAPLNPSTQATGYSAGVGTTELTSGTSNWYNYPTPYFSIPAGSDPAATGQSGSGVDGYHILLTQDVGATPTSNLASDCYAWVDDSDGESGGAIQVGEGDLSSCTLTNGTYYLLIQTKDNSGNIATPSQLFTYQFDSSNPVAPTTVSSTTVGYSATNQFDFFWPQATDSGPAGIAGYEYKTGSTDSEDPFSNWQYTTSTGATNVAAYTEGQNFFYVRSVDKAGNRSATTTNLGVSPFYYNASAPTAPRNIVITPSTTSTSPASSNVFSVTWDKPESYSGEIAKYYYCVNCTPSATTMTETTSSETVNRALSNLALATQQGKNTFYLVAEDNNINTETGAGNRNFEAYNSVDFYASTTAPGAPTNLVVTDASDRSNSIWRLTLTWVEPTTSTDLSRYDVYRSTDNSSYTKLGEVSSTAYTDTGLTQSTTYYYKVYSVDSAGSNSLASVIVSLAPEGRYNEPPMAGGAPLVSAGSTTAILTWTTSRPAFGTVEYGKTSNYGSAASETTSSTVHTVKLTGLASGEAYHYRVQNLDDSSLVGYERGEAYSSDYTFTTLNSAEISEIVVKDVGLDFAIISWITRTTSSSEVVYGKTLDYGSKVTVSTAADETEHIVQLEDLEHSTTYHFKIKGVTVDGDDIESQDISFDTVAFPKINAYVVKTDQSTGGTTVAAAWTTNKETTSVISYQRAELVDNSLDIGRLEQMSQAELARLKIKLVGDEEEVASNDLKIEHLLRVGSLDDGSVYVLRLKGRDEKGNEIVGDPIRYVTGKDTRAPVVSNLAVESQMSGSGADSKAQIIVSWETDEEASSQVIYGQGTGSDYPQSTTEDKSKKTRHIVVIRDLDPNTSYHLKVVSKDAMDNPSYSEDIIAVTPTTSESALDIVLTQLEDIFGFLRM